MRQAAVRVRTLAPRWVVLTLALAFTMALAACAGEAEIAAVPPTPVPPTPTAAPPPTEVPPTAVPPTAVPPTAVPEPTATAEPTPEPTATSAPEPTAEPEPEAGEQAPADDDSDSDAAAEPEEAPGSEADEADVATGSDAGVVPVVDGASIYSMNCARCHGENGEGATARSITGIGGFFAADPSPLINLVTNGGTQMPSFGQKLSASEITAVVDYVVSTF